MKEQDRQRAIRLRLARMDGGPARLGLDKSGPDKAGSTAIATGFAQLDRALGAGGVPRSRITELFGPSSSGKTTLLLQTIAHLQSSGLAAAWIDVDRTYDPAYAAQLGVVVERLPVAQPDAAEPALEIARQLAGSGAVDLLVVDSAAALVPSLELEAGIGQSALGLQSRVLASGLRKLASTVAKSGAAVVFLNQTRWRPDESGGEAETSAGGPPLKLYAAVRIALFAAGARQIGFRMLKNKVSEGAPEGRLEWQRGGGFAKSP
jgi:recombination protein RecA